MQYKIFLLVACLIFIHFNNHSLSLANFIISRECKGKDSTTGSCLPWGWCILKGGEIIGSCLLKSSVCCLLLNKKPMQPTSRYCDSILTAHCIELGTPDAEYFTKDRTCKITLAPKSKGFDQIKVDIKKFNLYPESDTTADCEDEYLHIDDDDSVTIVLCAKDVTNTIYYDFSTSQTLKLIFKTKARKDQVDIPEWLISITDETGDEKILPKEFEIDIDKSKGEERFLNICKPFLNHIKPNKLAPPGCLQYYTVETGTVKSFNYDGDKGLYPPNLHYAICFEKKDKVCGVRFTNIKFSVGSRDVDNSCPDDYLFIYKSLLSPNVTKSEYCGELDENSTILYTPPGPLNIIFHSGDDVNKSTGFKMDYELLTDCTVKN